MSGLTSPSLMFEEALTPIKGWFDEAALDIEGKISDDVTFTVPGGRVVHVSDVDSVGSGQILKRLPRFSMGVKTTHMALFLIQAQDDFDVNNPGTTPKGNFMHQAIAPTGVNSALVATGGYELQSTEYNTARSYSPGDLLTADADDTDSDLGGVLDSHNASNTKLTVPWKSGGTTQACCGVVSRGAFKNEHKVNSLHFWPVYLPGEA